MNTMSKCLIVAAAGLMGLSAGAEESAPKKIVRPVKVASLEGKIKSAIFDEATNEIKVEILTENYCNIGEESAKLKLEKSGRAVFGPHHYTLAFKLSTTKGCLPKEERKVVLRVPAPEHDNKLGFAQIVIRGEDNTYAAVRVTEDDFKAPDKDKDNQLIANKDDEKEDEANGNSSGTGRGATAEQLQNYVSGTDDEAAGSAR